MNAPNNYIQFARSLVCTLTDEIMRTLRSSADSERATGKELALREASGVLQGQATSFDIPHDRLALHGFDPMTDADLDSRGDGCKIGVESVPAANDTSTSSPEESLEAATLHGYVRDVAYLLRERAAEATTQRLRSASASEFDEGRENGLRHVLLWMQQGADRWLLDRDAICLSGFEPMSGDTTPPPPRPLKSE